MKNRRWLQYVKWFWTALVILGVVYYLIKNYASIIEHLRNVSLLHMIISMFFLIISKILLSELSRQSVYGQDWKPTLGKMFHIYSTIQLAKYLPGGIWHFVGRFGIYRTNGMSNNQAGRAMIIENTWLVSSAIFFGATISMLSRNDILKWVHISPTPSIRMTFAIALIILWLLVLFAIEQFAVIEKRKSRWGFLKQLPIQMGIWFFIGLSFYMILPIPWQNLSAVGTAIGSFSIAWAIGYLTIFAPSGVGIREVVLTALLAAYITPEGAAVYAALSRIIWVMTEILLGIFSELVFGSGKLAHLLRQDHASQE